MAEKSGKTSTTREKLPHDLVTEILSRLPADHLWPLRSVCKLWFQLIARNPQFAKSTFDTSVQCKSNPSFILALSEEETSNEEEEEKIEFYMATNHTECDKAIHLKLPFSIGELDPGCYPACYGVSNGMLCLSNEDKHEVYIWNPLTNHHITIPYPVTSLRSPDNHQSTVFGFGYLESVNEYTIIKLVSDYSWEELECHTEISLYTLGKDSSWRIIKQDVRFDITFVGMPCPQINGRVMWLARRDGELSVRTILIFDLKDELLYELEHPPIKKRSILTSILDLGGSLCLFNANHSNCVDMWIMKLDGSKHSMGDPVTLGAPEVVGDFSALVPLGVVAWSGDILVWKNQSELITYNLSTRSVNPLKGFCCPIVNAFAFAGSIISPRAINGAKQIWDERGL